MRRKIATDTIDRTMASLDEAIASTTRELRVILQKRKTVVSHTPVDLGAPCDGKQFDPVASSSLKHGTNESSGGGDERQLNGKAVLGLFCVLIPFLFPLGLLFGVLALQQIRKDPTRWKGERLARTVVLIATVEIALFLLILALCGSGGCDLGIGE